MNDDELLDALRTGLDAIDPAPASLRSKALDARLWQQDAAFDTELRSDSDLVGSGMRSAATSDSDTGLRDLVFHANGYDLAVTIDTATALDEGEVELSVIVTPPVDQLSLVSPFGDRTELVLNQTGHGLVRLELPAVAIEFRSASNQLIRTPLLRLY